MKRPIVRSIFRVLTAAAGLAVMSLGFQNCAGKGFEVASLEQAVELQSVNPELDLRGKLYVRGTSDTACMDGLDAIIEETPSGNLQLIRQDCQDLAKPLRLDVYKTSKMVHDPAFLIYEDRLFRLDPTTLELAEGESPDADLLLPTTALCRNEINEGSIRRVTDVRLYQDSEGRPVAKLLMGDYRSGTLLNAYSTAMMSLERVFDEDGLTQDQAVGEGFEGVFAITLKNDATIGDINYSKEIFGASAPAGYVDGEVYLSPDLKCYR